MSLLITILFVLAIAMFIADFARSRSLMVLGLAFLTGALLLISV